MKKKNSSHSERETFTNSIILFKQTLVIMPLKYNKVVNPPKYINIQKKNTFNPTNDKENIEIMKILFMEFELKCFGYFVPRPGFVEYSILRCHTIKKTNFRNKTKCVF